MKKVRVYELAKELNLESKTLVDFLVELGADIKNHMSTVESDIAEMVREHFLESDDELVESDEEIEAKKIKKRKKHSKRDEDPEFEDKKIEKIAKNGKGKVKTKGRTKGKNSAAVERQLKPKLWSFPIPLQ